MSTDAATIMCDDLETAIADYRRRGYRLDMIKPADAPREAVMSVPRAVAGGSSSPIRLVARNANVQPPATAGGTDMIADGWVRGRAGMEYRDLIPDRLGGRLIASHIRLTEGGEVSDYAHYHKIDFQMIYCKRGRIKVVYEDQGPPFWLETGDCVLQPPTIRHRVLECTAGAEVIEVSMPAEHETWVEHDVQLPTGMTRPEREFGDQRFVRSRAIDANGAEAERDLGISKATNGRFDARVIRTPSAEQGSNSIIVEIEPGEYLAVSFPANDEKGSLKSQPTAS